LTSRPCDVYKHDVELNYLVTQYVNKDGVDLASGSYVMSTKMADYLISADGMAPNQTLTSAI